MRLPLTTATLTALGRGLSADAPRRRRSRTSTRTVSDSVSRTAVLPGQSPLWRPPSRLTGLLERYDRMTPVLA